MQKIYALILMTAALILVFSGCSRKEEIPGLRVGMMSAVDAVPFYYALENGFFAREGVEVELIMFTNAQNRQTALQTSQVDGAMTDLVALVTNIGGDIDITGTLSTNGVFPILSNVSLFEKDKISSGVMEISVTNYILEQYLSGSHTIEKVYINEIPARLEAIISGQLDTGIFPEPFASIGELRGLEKIIFPDIPRESLNIIAFTGKALDEKKEALRLFHSAYGKAVMQMNSTPGAARDMLMRSLPNLPDEIRDNIHMPEYLAPNVPSDGFIEEIIRWTGGMTRREYHVTPEMILDRSFIRSD